MKAYLALLLKYQVLPRAFRSTTFMEVAGYPHYENVCSNILGFYLNPKAEHGFGNLLLKAFLKMCGKPEVQVPDNVTVTREYTTDRNTRIDLVVDAENFTLGIENKIFHWEANDFDIYSQTLETIGKNKEVIKVVLCIRIDPAQEAPKGGFIRYTYCEFWEHVRDLLGHHMVGENQKWSSYLIDFMEETNRLAGESLDEKSVTDFFVEHNELVERLVADRDRLINAVTSTLRNMKDRVIGNTNRPERFVNRGIWQTFTFANQIKVLDHTYSVDLNGGLAGWSIAIYAIGTSPLDSLFEIAMYERITEAFPNLTERSDSLILQQWVPPVMALELEASLTKAINAVVAFAESREAPFEP